MTRIDMSRRRHGRAAGALVAALALLLGMLPYGCATAPAPAPPEEPAPVVPHAVPPAPPPPASVRVTGSRLNVRESPSTSAPTIARVARGTRLAKRGAQGEWLEVELADGTRGWVHGRYVTSEPECQADSVEPVIVSDPVVAFVESAAHGRIVLEGTVSKSGEVVAIEVKENETGSPELAELAAGELRQLRFAPFVRNCRPVSFIYVYTRTY